MFLIAVTRAISTDCIGTTRRWVTFVDFIVYYKGNKCYKKNCTLTLTNLCEIDIYELTWRFRVTDSKRIPNVSFWASTYGCVTRYGT